MLNPYDNRVDYGKELKPPYSYKMDFAIGTTYNLSFDALTSACISMNNGFRCDDTKKSEEQDLLELATFDKILKNIAIFLEPGCIKKTNKKIMHIKLEDSIYEVKREKGIFHPKCWIVRYINPKGEIVYRFIILSRNLTFDDSWDIAASFDGKINKDKNNLNEPLIEFIKYLSNNVNDNDKIKKIKLMMNELSQVEFIYENFKELEFLPFGINNKNPKIDIFKDKKTNFFIMSPFLSPDIIKDFNNKLTSDSENSYLITRFSELCKLKKENCDKLNIYVINENMIEIEKDEIKNDIHAKIYFIQNGINRNLYIGSLNATNNAFYNNVELMIRLKCNNNEFDIKSFAESIIYPKNDKSIEAFTKIDIDDLETFKNDSKEKDVKKDMNREFKEILKNITCANVVKNKNKYNIEIKSKKTDYNYEVSIQPYYYNKSKIISNKMIFENLKLEDLSMIYIIKLKELKSNITNEYITKIETTNIPIEKRNSYIDSSFISNYKDFVIYLLNMLDDDGNNYIIRNIINHNNEHNEKNNRNNENILVYEELLKKAYVNKDIIKDIYRKLSSIKKNKKIVIDKELEKILKSFDEALK